MRSESVVTPFRQDRARPPRLVDNILFNSRPVPVGKPTRRAKYYHRITALWPLDPTRFHNPVGKLTKQSHGSARRKSAHHGHDSPVAR